MKPSEFPKNIKVLDQFYRVSYVERTVDVDVMGQHQVYGQTDFQALTIRIFRPKVYSSAEVWNTIHHEVLHIIINTLKIDAIETQEEKIQEKVIHLLATGVNTVMIDNKFCFDNIKD